MTACSNLQTPRPMAAVLRIAHANDVQIPRNPEAKSHVARDATAGRLGSWAQREACVPSLWVHYRPHTERATTWVAQGSWLPIWIFRFYFCNIRTGKALPDISSCTLVPQKQPLGAGDISRRVGIDSNFHVQVDTLFAALHMHRKFSGRFLRGSCKWIWRVVSANLQHAHQRKSDRPRGKSSPAKEG